MPQFKKVIGEKCYLSPISKDDSEQYVEWFNNLYTSSRMSMASGFLNVEKENEAIDHLLKEGNHIYGIVDLKTDRLIGNTGLHQIDHVDRSAMFGIFIGEKDYRGKGYGAEATRLLLDYAFNILNLHSVYLWVFSFNENAKRIYEKVGFKEQGRRREGKLMAGNYYDWILMDILDSEFEGSYVKKTVLGG